MAAGLLRLLTVTLLFGLVGCSTLSSNYVTPTVTLSSFTPVTTKGSMLSPQFEIRLHIVNPNASRLVLQGIAYTIELQGVKVMTGVANEIPVIDAYGEGDITLHASTSLLGGIRALSGLIRNQSSVIEYAFDAKLDPGGLMPNIRVREKGEFSLSGN